jgi:two-component system sensor histidine kinase and response regulator WspE
VVEDRQYFRFDGDNISLVNVHEILEIEKKALPQDDKLPVVVIGDHAHSYGLLVDRFVGEYDLVVRPLDPRLGKVPDISAVSVMLDGSPILIFDVEDLIRSVDKMLNRRKLQKLRATEQSAEETAVKRILVVDDSITVREMERKLLESRGYQVEVAVDGLAGWNTVRSEEFDLVISDVDMPRMNGIEFVTHIKEHEALRSLPVMIVSYKDSEEHRLQGLEAGADYYLTKSSFQDDSFINAVVDLIGEA